MKENSRRELEEYIKAADSWASDRNDMLARSRTVAWRVAAGASLIAVLEAIALMALAPLKKVEPYTLLVDRHTGYVEALKPLDRRSVSADSALTRSFLVQYVIAREGFAIDTVQSDYHKVALWSSGAARQQYINSMQPSNAASPLATYPRSTIVDVVIKSVSSLSPDTALVRFETQQSDHGQLVASQDWASVIRFGYSGEPMSVADRLVNPLGFKVLRYSRSEEIAPEPPPPPAAYATNAAPGPAAPPQPGPPAVRATGQRP